MADNYLEKRFSEVFRKSSYVDPETGFEENQGRLGIKFRHIPGKRLCRSDVTVYRKKYGAG